MLTLVVNGFGVNHLSKSNDEYLEQALKDKHEVEVNYEGNKLCSINIKCNCTKNEYQLNAPGCIKTPEKI